MFSVKTSQLLLIATLLFLRINAKPLPAEILGANVGGLHAGLNTNIFSKLTNALGGNAKLDDKTTANGPNESKEILGANIGDLHAGIDTNIMSKLKNDLEAGAKAVLTGNTEE
ncbi:hypothetical protein HHI36_022125 [Cryptolaemus montrouzieri]|uniref:Uncharacterized protein n=1 Tax=Cryptolaemus montrouzieri TaxID=559131 RepID=A0ABD2MZ38_9CUCU